MLPLVYRTDGSGGSRGGAQGARPPSPSLCLDQTEARRDKKIFGDRAPPYLRIWMTAPTLPSPTWRSGSATGRYGIGSLFAMGGKLWASLRSIPSWKSNLCCMLDTNVHWFVCLFVCFWKTKKKQTQWYLQLSQMAGFKLSKFILASDAEGNKTKQMKY